MKRSKFSEAQIAFVLKQAEDRTSVGEVCRKTGISDTTFYPWRKKYAGLKSMLPVSHACITSMQSPLKITLRGALAVVVMALSCVLEVSAAQRRV